MVKPGTHARKRQFRLANGLPHRRANPSSERKRRRTAKRMAAAVAAGGSDTPTNSTTTTTVSTSVENDAPSESESEVDASKDIMMEQISEDFDEPSAGNGHGDPAQTQRTMSSLPDSSSGQNENVANAPRREDVLDSDVSVPVAPSSSGDCSSSQDTKASSHPGNGGKEGDKEGVKVEDASELK